MASALSLNLQRMRADLTSPGHARLIHPTYLVTRVLAALLTHIDEHAYPADRVPESATVDALFEEHAVPREVAKMVLKRWFGKRRPLDDDQAAARVLSQELVLAEDEDERLDADAEETAQRKGKGREIEVELNMREIAKAVGLVVLQQVAKVEPVAVVRFLREWQHALGEVWADHVDLGLVQVSGCGTCPANARR